MSELELVERVKGLEDDGRVESTLRRVERVKGVESFLFRESMSKKTVKQKTKI